MKVYVEGGKVCNKTKIRMRLGKFCVVGIVDKTNGCRLDLVKITEWVLKQHQRYGNSTLEKDRIWIYS